MAPAVPYGVCPYHLSFAGSINIGYEELYPVSYTHLDVYKRQILKIKGLRAVQDYMLQEVQRVYRLQGFDSNDKHIEVIAVSYTHLDVYKRQHLQRTEEKDLCG